MSKSTVPACVIDDDGSAAAGPADDRKSAADGRKDFDLISSGDDQSAVADIILCEPDWMQDRESQAPCAADKQDRGARAGGAGRPADVEVPGMADNKDACTGDEESSHAGGDRLDGPRAEQDATTEWTATGRPMPELPPRGDIARLGVRTPGMAPKRIGSGRLVPARLTWKPGDPFAGSSRRRVNHFRWEIMLTSACVTAACGLCCLWLLRTILA